MLHPDPIFTYDLARQRQQDLASAAEWERLSRMARTTSANQRRRPTQGRLAAAWQRLSRSLAHVPTSPSSVRDARPTPVRSEVAHG